MAKGRSAIRPTPCAAPARRPNQGLSAPDPPRGPTHRPEAGRPVPRALALLTTLTLAALAAAPVSGASATGRIAAPDGLQPRPDRPAVVPAPRHGVTAHAAQA